jgi:hypothetical protein
LTPAVAGDAGTAAAQICAARRLPTRMPLKIPADAKIVSDRDLTIIRAAKTVLERVVEGEDGLIARVKQRMRTKRADFAQSDVVIAALRPGSAAGKIDASKLHQLVSPRGTKPKAGQLTLEQFLECVTVNKGLLAQYLPGDTIDGLTSTVKNPQPQLFTEFKEGVELDYEQLTAALGEAFAGSIKPAVPIKH